MAFVITMAGLSSRFHNAGYEVPKYALPIGSMSLLAASVSSFEKYFQSDLFIFVIRGDGFAEAFLKQEISSLGIVSFRILVLERDTLGQAESLFLGLQGYAEDFPIYVFNVDTIRLNFEKTAIEDKCDGYLEVFRGSGSNWSFVEPGKDKLVLRTTEKDPISDLCSDGLYFFRSHFQFQNAFLNLDKKNDLVKGEFYIAPLYNKLIADGAVIKFDEISSCNIKFCGTPAEYLNLVKEL
jgi:dTDP-glucose pyrophosphorylase